MFLEKMKFFDKLMTNNVQNELLYNKFFVRESKYGSMKSITVSNLVKFNQRLQYYKSLYVVIIIFLMNRPLIT